MTLVPVRPRPLMARLVLPLHLVAAIGLLPGLIADPAGAQPVGQPAARPLRPTPEQLKKIFPEQRSLLLDDHRSRIAILQKGERCMTAATSSEALRDCLRQEREAYSRQREQNHEQMRQLYTRNGLPLPEAGGWKGKGKGQGYGAPAPGGS